MMNKPVEISQGDSPLILAMPHTGLYVPDEISVNLNARGKELTDTDWHIDRLYKGLMPKATIVRALFHRYVIDANRDPANQSLYPGQNTTSLCPLTDFDGNSIYSSGGKPDAQEISRRKAKYHAPYHNALQEQIDRLRNRFGVVILYDCHSIRSHIPYLFEGQLPDFNIGTNNGATCDNEIQMDIENICAQADGYTSVLNGRFKGGWTTRHYGQPDQNVHAVQMELSQQTYLKSQTAPFAYDQNRAEKLQPILQSILTRLTNWALENSTNEADI